MSLPARLPRFFLAFLFGLFLLPSHSLQHAALVLYVNVSDPTCQGQSPCFTKIQAAIDAAQPGDTIRVQAGEYDEALKIKKKQQLVLEADPALSEGSVMLDSVSQRCGRGDVITLIDSADITIRGFTITDAGGQAIDIKGGGPKKHNEHIVIERNRIFGNGTNKCQGGIRIGPGTPDTVILNNLIYGNGQDAINFYGGKGGPHYVVQNVIHGNRRDGINVTKGQEVVIVNNLITHNGTDPKPLKQLFGVRRPAPKKKSRAENAQLLHNLICGNSQGELFGPMLDGLDAGNLTPTGSEGPGVTATPQCADSAVVYANVNGLDGQPNTKDDNFTLAFGSPAVDAGTDPRTQGIPIPNANLEQDFFREAVRPSDGDLNSTLVFDIGAIEGPGTQCTPGAMVPCYSGPGGTQGVGICRAGTRTCGSEGTFGLCQGEVIPQEAESCNGLDDDCDAQTDEGFGQQTCGIGACQRTVNTCENGQQYVCTPGAPIAEICGNTVDDDCDGQTDELDACPVNQPPQITSAPVVAAAEGQAYSYDVDATDPDAGDTLTFSLTVAPFGMTIDPNTGVMQWTPVQVQTGEQAVTVQVRDNGGLFSRQSFSVQVAEANRAPTAVDDSYEAEMGKTLTVPARGILANDTDPNQGNTLSATLVSPPSNGDLSLNPDGSFAYTPKDAFVPNPVVGNLTRLIPEVTASASSSASSTPSQAIDDNIASSWLAGTGDAANLGGAPFLEILFPVEVTVTELQMLGNRGGRANGFDIFAGVFRLFDAGGTVLFDSGVVDLPAPDRDATVAIPDLAGVRRVRFTATADEGNNPGFAELRVIGPTLVPLLPELEWSWTGSTVLPDFKQVISTPIVANLTDDNQDGKVNQDDIPDVIFVSTNLLSGGLCQTNGGVIRAVSGADGSPLFDATDAALRTSPCSPVAVGDLDGDGRPEIVGYQLGDRLVILNADGSLERLSETLANNRLGLAVGTSPSIADLNHDGVPELVIGATVLDATGHILFSRTDTGNFGFGSLSTTADLDLDGDLEIVTGFEAYRSDGSTFYNVNPFGGSIGGYPAIGNFDDDPFPEVVVVANGQVYLLEHDGARKWGPKAIPGSGQGGPPTVADFDGDGEPEIGVAGALRYVVFETNGDVKWQASVQDGSSNITGSSVFDFDNDGQAEVVYNDELKLRVFRGSTGELLFETKNTSGTGTENPVVADVDNDGHAEIVVVRNDVIGFGTQQGLTEFGIFVYGGRNNDWVRTRRIWNQHAYHVTNVNEDGTIPKNEQPNWLTPGLNNFRTNTLAPDDDGADKFVYKATDGSLDSNEATVFITVRQPNAPPKIISTPLAAATVGLPYLHVVRAIDPDVGDELTFALIAAPAGMTIDPATGLLRWTPTSGQLGGNNVTVRVEDRGGLTDFQIFTVQVSAPATVPNVVGQAPATAESMIGAAGLTVGVTSAASSTIVPVGQVLSQNPAAGTSVAPGSAVNLVISTGPPPPGLTLVSITVSPSDLQILTAEVRAFTATGVFGDGSTQNLTDQVTWESTDTGVATITSTGVATGVANGTTTIRAGKDGINGSTMLTVRTRVADATPPTAAITAPAPNSTITAPTDIIGTATDANFSSYTLEIAPAGETTFTLLTTGTAPVTNGQLGTLDPTVLLNDIYTVRLTVFDLGGNTTTAEVTVQVTREQKVGLFTVTFQDLSVAVSGLPITINRTYDSRDKRTGDFGVGWRLDVQTMRVRANRVQGTGWQVNKSGLNFRLVSADQHKVSLTLPDGTVEEFDLVVTPAASFLLPLQTVTASYAPRPGTLGTLAPLDNPNLVIFDNQPGPVELLDDLTFNPYNPQTFRYTSVDGREFVINKTTGVQSVRDLNGNTLTFGAGGIIHSAGKSVAFTRDAQGRIAQITDPEGHFYQYAYDANGDLVTYTDPVGNTTRYAYNASHGLLDIQDPAGNHAVRNEYDTTGRLIATTDAQGNRIEFTHDISGSREVVRDRLGNPTVFEYDAAGNVTAKIDALNNRTEFTHDSRGNQLTETDPLGRVASKTYDAFDNELSTTDFDGNTTTFTYNARGQALTITDPEGRTTNNEYDANGNPTRVTDPEGGIARYTYDAAGNRPTTTDPLGNVTQFAYDAFGNKTSETDPLGVVTIYVNDANGNVLSSTKAGVQTTQFQYDSARRLVKTIDALGQEEVTTYSLVGDGRKPATVTDARGQVTRYDYDARGNLIGKTLPDGSAETTSYDAENRVVSRTDRDGRTTSFQHDALGQQMKITHPDGASSTSTYDAVGRVATRTDERGNATTFSYAPNKQTATDASGNVTVHQFDSRQQRSTTTDALGRTTRFAYNSAGNLTRITFPDGTTRTTSYDAAKRKIEETDQAGQSTQFVYDATGRLIRVTDAAGSSTAYSYDALGNQLTQSDANSHTTQMTSDILGRETKRSRPLGQFETFTYDANGNQLSHTDFNGQTTSFTYDANDRQIGKNLPGGVVVSFAYTPNGLRLQAGGDAYVHDGRNWLTTETKANGDILTYTYDAAGNRSTMTTPQGTTTYTYDALNRLATVVDATGTTTYTYDAVGNLASTSYPNGTSAIYSYDTLNRLVQMVNSGPSGLISSYTYTLGTAGNRLQVIETGPATTGRTVSYAYDAVYRLIEEHIDEPGATNDQTITYTYDAVGNRLRKTAVQGTKTTDILYAYDANDRLLTEAQTITVASRPPGEGPRYVLAGYSLSPFFALVFAVGITWTRWDRLRQRARRRLFGRSVLVFVLVAAAVFAPVIAHAGIAQWLTPRAAEAQTMSTVTLTYTYDANGNSLIRTNGTGTDTYTYDAENRLLSASVPSGPVSYTYDADGMRTSTTASAATTTFLLDKNQKYAQVVVETTGGAVATYTYGNQLLSQTQTGGGAHFYLTDGHLSTRQLTTAAGGVSDTYTYDAFGVLLTSTGATPNHYLYTGEQFDPNVGFYYLRARYYDQATGRFITTDPQQGNLFDPVSLHRYLYANADPVNNRDPSGSFILGTLVVATLIAVGLFAILYFSILAPALKGANKAQRDEDRKSFEESYGDYLISTPAKVSPPESLDSARALRDHFRAGPDFSSKLERALIKAFKFDVLFARARGSRGDSFYWVLISKNGQFYFILVPPATRPGQEGEPLVQDFDKWEKGWGQQNSVGKNYHIIQ
ncbi:MAG: VCBS repeat-containing protein [Deltaproteobacteria bacterium]|nr:VCBS repeat-containing protein [Deltaproteobacteria bacterium]